MKSVIYHILPVVVASLLVITVQAQQKISLQDAVTLAAQENPELKAVSLEREKSRQQRVIARSLFLPTVSANAQASHFFQLTPFFGFGDNNQDGRIPYGRFGGEDQFAAFVSAVQPLYNPLAFPSMQDARLKEEESQLSVNSQRSETSSMVKQTYLQLLVLNERIKLQRESIHRNERVLQDSRILLVQGKALRVDTLRAYTAVKNLEPELLRLTYAAETGKLQLKTLMGVDSLQDIELTDSLVLPNANVIPGEEEVYSAARNNNPDFQLIALREQIAEQQVRVASSNRLPVVSAVAQYQLQSQTNKFDYGNAYYPSSSFVGLQISVPVFNGLRTSAKVRQAQLSKEQSALRTKHAYDQLRSTVHQIVADNQESLARLRSAATVQETAELSYSIVKYRYQKGIASRLELSDAELSLSTAQSNYLEAVYDNLTAQIALQRIMGRAE